MEQLAKFENANDIYLCGDFNSRTGKLKDYPVDIPGTDGDLDSIQCYPSVYSNSSINERISRDATVNEYGKNLIHVCKSTGLRIMNGRLGDVENSKDFTCYKGNGASTVDYLLCRPQNMLSVTQFRLLPKRTESDHRPLQFSLVLPHTCDVNSKYNMGTKENPQCEMNKITVFKWNGARLTKYRAKLNSNECNAMKEQILTSVIDPEVTSDKLSEQFYKFINTGIENIFKPKKNNCKSHFPKNNWFNDECKWLKKQANEYAKAHDISQSPYSEIYHELENEYRKTTQKCKRQYRNEIRLKLEQCHSSNPTTYWKIWKSFRQLSSNNSKLTLDDFNLYFQNQIKPPSIEYHDNSYMSEIRNIILAYSRDHEESVPDENF